MYHSISMFSSLSYFVSQNICNNSSIFLPCQIHFKIISTWKIKLFHRKKKLNLDILGENDISFEWQHCHSKRWQKFHVHSMLQEDKIDS